MRPTLLPIMLYHGREVYPLQWDSSTGKVWIRADNADGYEVVSIADLSDPRVEAAGRALAFAEGMEP